MTFYYVDTSNGLDTNNGLSSNTAYKTLQALLNNITYFTEDSTIYLSDGLYECNLTIVTKIPANITIYVIGNGLSTTLKPTEPFGLNNTTVGTKDATLTFSKLILDFKSMYVSNNHQTMNNNFNLNNVAIINSRGGQYSSFSPQSNSIFTFKNCVAIGESNLALRCTSGSINLYNCYGRFGNGYGTTQNKWDIENNIITSNPQVNTKYQFIDKNISNNIGVYGGEYPWLPQSLIKYNNQYYSIKPKFYNVELKQYAPLDIVDFENQKFLLDDLFDEIKIGDETFKPIDKFNEFTIINDKNVALNVNGMKTNSELIVMNYDITIFTIQLIHYIDIMGSNGNKVVFSFDSGQTWNTYNNGFIVLDNTISLNNYENLSELELVQWNLFKSEITEKGMDISALSAVNFNLVNFDKIRFAYVINRDSYANNSSLSKISLTYDESAHLIKVKSDEMDLKRYSHTIQVIPKYNTTYSETRVFLNQKFKSTTEDNREVLDTPILNADRVNNEINISWNTINNCDYYRLYLNGEVIYQGSDLSYNYPITKRGSYNFAVRAYSNDVKKYKESGFSNGYYIDTYGYLSTANNQYVVIQKDGKYYKFISKR